MSGNSHQRLYIVSFKPDEGQTVANPRWTDIEAAIRALDGGAVFLKGPGLASMTIGGQQGRYFVQLTLDGAFFHTLLGPSKHKTRVPIVLGHQEVLMEENRISVLKDVLAAAKTFAYEGVVDKSLRWKLL
jgi:hypothetical protein